MYPYSVSLHKIVHKISLLGCVYVSVCVCVCLCGFLLWRDHWQGTKNDIGTGGTRGEMAQESPGTGQSHDTFWVIFVFKK